MKPKKLIKKIINKLKTSLILKLILTIKQVLIKGDWNWFIHYLKINIHLKFNLSDRVTS